MINLADLESHLVAMGDFHVFTGDPFVENGLELLGAKEGDISVAFNAGYNNLTFPEHTGDAVHGANLKGYNPIITVPLIIGNPALWAKLSPTGIQGGGYSSEQPVTETSVVLVPNKDLVAAGTTGYSKASNPGTWSPSAPQNWVWFWRAYIQFPDLTLRNADQGKSAMPVTIQTMYDSARPEGHKIFTIGDPSALTPTPIDVVI